MTIRAALAAIAILASATGAHAQAFTTDGVATGQARTEVIAFGADHMVMNSHVDYTVLKMDDDTHPMNLLKGPCFGTMEARGGAVEGNGVCVLDGLEGDRVLLHWVARRMDPQGRIAGYWTINAGTGLWLQASGGGTFVSEVNRTNGTATNTIKGAITLR